MITKAWFIVAVMSGVYTDGTKDIFIFQNPLDHGHFHSSAMCQKFIGDYPFKLARALIKQYGNRPPEQIMCVPEETVRMFINEGGRRGEKSKTCDTCGQKLKGQYCEFCHKSGDNGGWIDKVIEQAKDPRHDQSAFKDKKKKNDTGDT